MPRLSNVRAALGPPASRGDVRAVYAAEARAFIAAARRLAAALLTDLSPSARFGPHHRITEEPCRN